MSEKKIINKRLLYSHVCLAIYLILGGHLFLKYTLKQGLYFEFSLLAFLGLALAGYRNSSRLAISTLAFAMPQLSTWFMDTIWFGLSGHSLFGILETKYHPAISNADFYVYQYPLILLPSAWLLIRELPKPSRPPFVLTSLLSVIGLILSRFVFRGDADVNCSTLSCLEFFHTMPAHFYPWLFIFFYTGIALAFVPFINRYFHSLGSKIGLTEKHPQSFAAIYIIFALTLFFCLAKRFVNTPRFFCESSPSAPEGVELNCKYALDVTGTHFSQYFVLKNKTQKPQQCNLYMTYKDQKEIMYSAVLIRPKRNITLSVTVPNPTIPEGITVLLTPECSPLL